MSRHDYDPDRFWLVVSLTNESPTRSTIFDSEEAAQEFARGKADAYVRSPPQPLMRPALAQAAVFMYVALTEFVSGRSPDWLPAFANAAMALAQQDHHLGDVFRDTRKLLLWGPVPDHITNLTQPQICALHRGMSNVHGIKKS